MTATTVDFHGTLDPVRPAKGEEVGPAPRVQTSQAPKEQDPQCDEERGGKGTGHEHTGDHVAPRTKSVIRQSTRSLS